MPRCVTVLLSLLATSSLFCGSRGADDPAATTRNPTKGKFPQGGFMLLTETEVARYARLLPAVHKAIADAGHDWAENYGEDYPEDIYTCDDLKRYVPGLEKVVRDGGMSWAEFSSTALKVVAAEAALSLSSSIELLTTLGDTANARVERSKLSQLSRVPEQNKRIVAKYVSDPFNLSEIAYHQFPLCVPSE